MSRLQLQPGQRLESRQVLAGAYRGDIEKRALLTHAVIVEADGDEVRVLCSQPLDHVADANSGSEEDLVAPPTCSRCLERWERLRLRDPSAGYVPNVRAKRPTPSQLRLLQRMKDSTDQNGENRFYGSGAGYKDAIELFVEQGWVTRRPNAWPAIDLTPDGRALVEAYTPNHAAVHYVWLVDYRGVPLDTEGPYGPMSLARAEPFARIGATKGEHDRVVSLGRDIMAPGFEILRRYRRGTGERVQ